jgi:P-type E1-E2 ATPase
VQKKWTEIRVGHVVKVQDNELFPADLMCLHCELEERICFVKTTNLDGETNLKVKRCAPPQGAAAPAPRLGRRVRALARNLVGM